MASPKAERERQFRTDGAGVGFLSVELLECAYTLLCASLRDRRSLMSFAPDNHFSPHATGTTIMAVTALDAWLNEVIVELLHFNDDQRSLGSLSLVEKYTQLATHFGTAPQARDDIVVLNHARNEIVHFLPRWLGAQGAIPPWLQPLRDRRLLLERTPAANNLPDKLCSYRLAFWAWSTVSSVVKELVAASGPTRSQIVGSLAGNFEWHETVCPPDKLNEYDARHNIKPPLGWDDETAPP